LKDEGCIPLSEPGFMGFIDYWEINIEFCFMLRNVILTKDGSHTVMIPEMNVTYHSLHGAIQESRHVFIEAGLKSIRPLEAARRMDIFEMGFGTGLNALLTFIETEKLQRPIYYSTIELYPLNKEEIYTLNYCEQLDRPDLQTVFEQLHQCEWESEIAVTPFFTFYKTLDSLINLPCRQAGFSTNQLINLIYFDAFAPAAQPELWTKEIFEKLYSMMNPAGILVTYCSKGDVRRAMQGAGFSTEKIPGPPGKREMIRAVKPVN
jgi:tRNA U34 5-methylaminomethyl-2-thiouridine-forming methyltransferase MnmC